MNAFISAIVGTSSVPEVPVERIMSNPVSAAPDIMLGAATAVPTSMTPTTMPASIAVAIFIFVLIVFSLGVARLGDGDRLASNGLLSSGEPVLIDSDDQIAVGDSHGWRIAVRRRVRNHDRDRVTVTTGGATVYDRDVNELAHHGRVSRPDDRAAKMNLGG
jgi:hypothetical protein